MTEYEARGIDIRHLSKSLVLHFMQATDICGAGKEGLTKTQIFKACGFDW